MKSKKHLSMCARIRERGRLRQTKVSSRQRNLSLVVTGLLLVSIFLMMPTAKAPPDWDEWEYVYDVDNVLPENADPAWWRFQSDATRSIVHNNDLLRMEFGVGATSEEYRYNLTGEREFLGEVKFKIYNASAGAYFSVYRSDGRDFGMGLTIQLSHDMQLWGTPTKTVVYPNSDGVNYTFSLHIYPDYDNNQQCVEGYVNHSYFGMRCYNRILDLTNVSWLVETGGLTQPWVEWDYVVFTEGDPLADLSDELDELRREIARLKKRINDMDDSDGYVENPPNECYIPYMASGYLLDSRGTIFADPFATWIYRITDSQDPAASNAHVQIYPATATDYNILEDEITWGWPGAATQIWINDTTPAIIFSTTDDSYNSWDLVANNVTIAGEALTFDTLGDNSRSVRRALVRVTDTFDWSINTETMLHSTTVSITNTLGIDATRLQTYIASNPDYVIDEGSVTIVDQTSGVTLDPGLHYSVDASGFLLARAFWNDTDQVSYNIEYNIYTPASEALEISCRLVGPTIDMRYYNGVQYQYTTCSAYNGNTFDLVNGRVIFDGSGIRDDIDWDGIQIVDPTGKKYSSIYPLTRDKIAVQGVSIDAASTVVFDCYFRTIPTEPDLWRSFQKWGYWLPALALVAAIITSVPLMTTEKRDPITGRSLTKDRRKMLRRWALSFLFIFVAGTVAWMYAVALS